MLCTGLLCTACVARTISTRAAVTAVYHTWALAQRTSQALVHGMYHTPRGITTHAPVTAWGCDLPSASLAKKYTCLHCVCMCTGSLWGLCTSATPSRPCSLPTHVLRSGARSGRSLWGAPCTAHTLPRSSSPSTQQVNTNTNTNTCFRRFPSPCHTCRSIVPFLCFGSRALASAVLCALLWGVGRHAHIRATERTCWFGI